MLPLERYREAVQELEALQVVVAPLQRLQLRGRQLCSTCVKQQALFCRQPLEHVCVCSVCSTCGSGWRERSEAEPQGC